MRNAEMCAPKIGLVLFKLRCSRGSLKWNLWSHSVLWSRSVVLFSAWDEGKLALLDVAAISDGP